MEGCFVICLVALGANLPSEEGGPLPTLEAALSRLDMRGARVVARSRWYRTPAWPVGAGPEFVNGAARLESALAPAALLDLLHDVERDLGRVRAGRWGARVCDIDLLAADQRMLPDAETLRAWMDLAPEDQARRVPRELILPHPRMHQRGFVLAPLADVAPDWRHPVVGETVREMLAGLSAAEMSGIEPLE